MRKLAEESVQGEIISFIVLPPLPTHTPWAAALILAKIFGKFSFQFAVSYSLHIFVRVRSFIILSFSKHLPQSVKRRLQSEATRSTCIWMSGKNPTNSHNRKVSRSNAHWKAHILLETTTHMLLFRCSSISKSLAATPVHLNLPQSKDNLPYPYPVEQEPSNALWGRCNGKLVLGIFHFLKEIMTILKKRITFTF